MKRSDFRGVYPALTTPFHPDLSLDAAGFARLVDAVIGDGVHGIVVNGCTGESWALDAAERGRNELIFTYQNNRNPFVEDASLAARISDF